MTRIEFAPCDTLAGYSQAMRSMRVFALSSALCLNLACNVEPACPRDACQDAGGGGVNDGGASVLSDAGGTRVSDAGGGLGASDAGGGGAIDAGTNDAGRAGVADAGGAIDGGSLGTATALMLSGPASGAVGSPSRSFLVSVNGLLGGSTTITLAASTGAFTPSTVVLSPSVPEARFRYTPASAGVKSISASSPGLSTAIASYEGTTAAATAFWVEGPTTGQFGIPSEPFTVGANGTLSGPVTANLSTFLGGGTFTPTSITLSSASPIGMFTFTALRAEFSGLVAGGSLSQTMFGYSALSTPATQLTLTGPSGGPDGVESMNFVVRANGDLPGNGVVVTPSDGNAGGTFTPVTVTLAYRLPSQTFTYRPSGAGMRTISLSNSGGLTNPGSLTYVATANPATAVTLYGPGRGPVSSTSASFTIGVDAVLSGPLTVTPSAADGTFTPASVTLTASAPTARFRYSSPTEGMKTISTQNSGGLANASVMYMATSGVPTVVWFEGPVSGPAGMASSPFTVAVDGVLTGPLTVSFGLVSGSVSSTFSPSQVVLGPSALSGTFTLTPSQAGFAHVNVGNNGGFVVSEFGYTAQ